MPTAILSRHYALTVKRSSVTLATIALLVCVVSPSYAQIPNNGNLSAQEYGDAVYRQIDSFWLNFFGADYNWVGWDKIAPLDGARQSGNSQLVAWLIEKGAKPARELGA